MRPSLSKLDDLVVFLCSLLFWFRILLPGHYRSCVLFSFFIILTFVKNTSARIRSLIAMTNQRVEFCRIWSIQVFDVFFFKQLVNQLSIHLDYVLSDLIERETIREEFFLWIAMDLTRRSFFVGDFLLGLWV